MSEDKNKLEHIRHSLAHILASAVLEMFPQAQLGVGPVIEHGFYYDFLLPRTLTPEDLGKLEKRMRALVKEKLAFERMEMSTGEAKKFFAERKQPFKIELIEDIEKFGTTELQRAEGVEHRAANSKPLALSSKPTTVTLYKTGKFIDLCRGGHVENTSEISADSFKLDKISGAYWRGDQKNPQLQRIYGLAFENSEALAAHLRFLEEVAKRDHKKLGSELELFMFHHTAPGMPYWLPKGVIIYNELINFWRHEHIKYGYQEIVSPLLNKKELYEISGHFEHYWQDMFVADQGEGEVEVEGELYGIKAMNCPNAMVVFGSKGRSYRELPLRLSDTDMLHRFELSGTLNGLLRVREFRQDDAHCFVMEDQIPQEYERILEIVKRFYAIFKLEYSLRLGTRPEIFMGDIATWNKAEAQLTRILKESGKPYTIKEGDGAFYGPKVDILMNDALGRQWQMGTIQLDFQQPRRFKLEYTAQDGSRKTPVAIHRVIYGSLERFIGILIEHFAGAFPVWLSPVQVYIGTVGEAHRVGAQKLGKQLAEAGIRVEVDDGADTVGYKIRKAEKQKIPYMLIIGDKEKSLQKLTVRIRGQQRQPVMTLAAFVKRVRKEIAEKV
ncbi:threonine--tRNA ligase [Candidatus Uhrbacteria bacterium]|nr:threonine--tRNA ligase [Candidatus Uhrbacteria bacterium]